MVVKKRTFAALKLGHELFDLSSHMFVLFTFIIKSGREVWREPVANCLVFVLTRLTSLTEPWHFRSRLTYTHTRSFLPHWVEGGENVCLATSWLTWGIEVWAKKAAKLFNDPNERKNQNFLTFCPTNHFFDSKKKNFVPHLLGNCIENSGEDCPEMKISQWLGQAWHENWHSLKTERDSAWPREIKLSLQAWQAIDIGGMNINYD